MSENPGEPEAATVTAGVSGEKLKRLIERIEKVTEERDAAGMDIRDIYSEAKAHGFDTKVMRQIIARRKMNSEMRREQEELLDLYQSALGME